MKVLLLSCNTGEGHNSAATAVSETLEAHGIECNIKNAFDFISDTMSELISKGHVFVYRNMPHVFGAGYKIEEKYPPRMFYRKMARGAMPLYKYLKVGEYDTVICSHIFAAMMLTECRHRCKADVKAYVIATDYTCSPGLNMLDMDGYFIPHKRLVPEFVSKGIPADKIVVSGIPVSQRYFSEKTQAQSRASLGLDDADDVVLLSCGSMGCGPMYELTHRLLSVLGGNARLCVVCGSNKKLYDELMPACEDKRLILEGYTSKMFDYMNSADVFITKPGGLSTTEAMALGIPLVFVNAVPGCESRNLSFMTEIGYAVTAKTTVEIAELVKKLVDQKSLSSPKTEQWRVCACENGAECIYGHIVGGGGKCAEKT